MRVAMSGRIVKRNVGGNTTYGRALKRGLESRGIEIDLIPYRRSPSVTAIVESLYAFRPPKNVDVIHYLADTGSLIRTRKPTVVTVHGVASRWFPGARSRSADTVWRARVQRAIGVSDAIVTVSESSADDIASEFQVDRSLIHVIYHGLDHSQFEPPKLAPKRLEHLSAEPFVLYVGNIEPRKNLIALVRAFDCAVLSKARLVVAGRPAWDYRESLDAFAGRENVEYLGFVSATERAWLMTNCALFAFPSLYEGFGLPVLEALGVGAPVICSDRGSLPEVAGPSKIFEDTSVDAISAGITDALSDVDWTARVRVDGPKWASQFTWDQCVSAHLGVYDSLVR